MVNNPKIECKAVFNKNGKINEELSDPMIVKYFELNNKYHFKVNMECLDIVKGELLNNTQLKQELFFKRIGAEIKNELSQFNYSDAEIADILVKLLYYIKPSSHKSVLWFCYGKHIVENLKKHLNLSTKIIQCIDCGEWIEVNTKDNETCRCRKCYKEYRKVYYREKKREQRLKLQMSTAQA